MLIYTVFQSGSEAVIGIPQPTAQVVLDVITNDVPPPDIPMGHDSTPEPTPLPGKHVHCIPQWLLDYLPSES